mgnify:CR=1 FL=1
MSNSRFFKKHKPVHYLFALCAGAFGVSAVWVVAAKPTAVAAEEADILPKAFINGEGPDWRTLWEEDFVNVNCYEDTFRWGEDGVIYCTGEPIGVIRTTEKFTNFELVMEWRHMKFAGNSGLFLWMIDESLEGLEPGKLPHGIEVQILDLGYAEQYEERTGSPGDWFTTHGDVFPVGEATMDPFPPVSPNGQRSFPSKDLTKGVGEWNHYYVRAINGEVRLWVNGEEVSGGNNCTPSTGYLALESEGSPIEFRGLRVRQLP